jgi:hypothetical protein
VTWETSARSATEPHDVDVRREDERQHLCRTGDGRTADKSSWLTKLEPEHPLASQHGRGHEDLRSGTQNRAPRGRRRRCRSRCSGVLRSGAGAAVMTDPPTSAPPVRSSFRSNGEAVDLTATLRIAPLSTRARLITAGQSIEA